MDCVAGGASVGFMRNLDPGRARAWWRGVAAAVARGERELFVAEDAAGVCGTVQLVPAPFDNQPHRADIAKMLVHRRARRRGVGDALLRAAEEHARERGLRLLVLDTASDDASRIYARHGWVLVGTVPDYALLPDGSPCDTVFWYRRLEGGARP